MNAAMSGQENCIKMKKKPKFVQKKNWLGKALYFSFLGDFLRKVFN